MNQELLTTIQLAFYAVVTLLLIILAAQLGRIIRMLSESKTMAGTPAVAPSFGPAATADSSEEELAAIMAVLGKIMPDRELASVRIERVG